MTRPSLTESQVTSLSVLFCLAKNIKLSITEENYKVFTFMKLELMNLDHFCLKYYLNNWFIIKIVADSFSVSRLTVAALLFPHIYLTSLSVIIG